MKKIIKKFSNSLPEIENILEGDMEEYLRRNKYERTNTCKFTKKNYSNGYSNKNLRSSFSDVDLDVFHYRNTEFDSQIIKEYETVCTELYKKHRD